MQNANPLTLEVVETRMQPGAYSRSGFLVPGSSLRETLEIDAAALGRLGLTAIHISVQLERLVGAAAESTSRRAVVERAFAVTVVVFKGFQICPWARDPHHSQCTEAGGVRYGGIDWTIRDLKTRREMMGSGLGIHLIRAHGFFGGCGTHHRLEPEGLASLLRLTPK